MSGGPVWLAVDDPAPGPRATTENGITVVPAESLHASLRDGSISGMGFLNEVTQRFPEAISFAAGRPQGGGYDIERVIADLRRHLAELEQLRGSEYQRTALFQYGPAAGIIREHIAMMLARQEGIEVDPESIVVTVGGQEAIFLTLRTLFGRPDHLLLVPEACYVGVTGAARLLDIPVAPVLEGPQGMRAADVASAAAAARASGMTPRACYVIPDAANPSGTTLSLEERKSLLGVATAENMLILEDSPYRMFVRAPELPSLKAMDTERRVIQLGTFAKSVFPGARVGYIVADQHVADGPARRLLASDVGTVKSMITLNTATLSQAVIAGALLRTGHDLHGETSQARAHYLAALRQARDALDRYFPAPWRDGLGIRWNDPDGGFFLTLTLPFPVDDALLGRSARDYGVIWMPMRYFAVPGSREEMGHSMRLACSALGLSQVDEGIARLAGLILDQLRIPREGGARHVAAR
jgi:(S)-3,5-dihydroxyphenylglycine transaminase